MPTSLTFAQLREANTARLPQFKNSKGEPAHSEADGSNWVLSTWSNATFGELGEMGEMLLMYMQIVIKLGLLANHIKKVERGDEGLEAARQALGKEMADVLIYMDIFAMRCGVDLGHAIKDKFNEVSRRVGAFVWLGKDGVIISADERQRAVDAYHSDPRNTHPCYD